MGKRTDFPAIYPAGANVPQAWASGAIFQLLQTIFGLRADAPHAHLYVAPSLPHWLPDITLEGLRVGDCSLDLRFWREGDRSRWEVLAARQTGGSSQPSIAVLDDPECATS